MSESPGIGLPLPLSFPPGEYTPFGYIDNPHHTLVTNRSGVLRSVPPLGLGWWRRRFKGAYGPGPRDHVNYISWLELGVTCAGVRLLTTEDFAAAGVTLVSRYHTKHVLSYDFTCGGVAVCLRYFLAGEHALACQAEVCNESDLGQVVALHATHRYGNWETPWWGSDGIGARYRPELDATVSAIWAYGDYFALGATNPSRAHHGTADPSAWQRWLRSDNPASVDGASVRGPGPLLVTHTYELVVPSGGRATTLILLCRGRNEEAAVAELAAARTGASAALERQLDADEAFWSTCPQLTGDWPDTWKRGWVYDFETLRMNVRPPVGIFRHPWDAMQIHSPRVVLGEAAVDMFALGQALPELAREVLLGTFADAPAPNVPCCREDASVNMIAADGSACGTAPCWCFPFIVLRALYAASGDDDWLAQLYPYLKAYLDWWLAQRTDEHGWFHCKCDWESGQDGSKRFPEAEGGLAESVRTVDVEASMAQALQLMAALAERLGAREDAPRWAELAAQKTAATRTMFVDGWFRDFDGRTGRPIIRPEYLDIMMLTPLTCGVATPEQIAAVRPKFEYFRAHPRGWLEWPSFFLAYTEAAWTAGLRSIAAEATADVANRIYPRLDARTPLFSDPRDPLGYRVPGVANEFWPLSDDQEPGGEAYGWGATLPLHVIRSIFGFRETADPFADACHLSPALPAALRVPERRYGLRNLRYRALELDVTAEVLGPTRLRLTLEYAGPVGRTLVVRDADGRVLHSAECPEAGGTAELEIDDAAVLTLGWAPPPDE